MRIPDTGVIDARASAEDAVRAAAEAYFGEKLRPEGKLFQVAATSREDYVEVMVFIANVKDDPPLYGEAKAWANSLQQQLEGDGLPAIVYIHTYTPPVRRIRNVSGTANSIGSAKLSNGRAK